MQQNLINKKISSHSQTRQVDQIGQIGIDEAGRGCLAGPVVAAVVHFDATMLSIPIEQLDDSKKLSPKKRELLAQSILKHAMVGIGIVWQNEIDRINILQATFYAMSKALKSLYIRHPNCKIENLYIDGNKTIPIHILQSFYPNEVQQVALVSGDSLMPIISAASIIAKTHRDRILKILHNRWPQYNFAKHKGYGTKEHIQAIEKYGSCPLHRMTFAPLNTISNINITQGSLC